MSFVVVQPPKDETEFAELGKRLVEAGRALGMQLEAEGFLFSWIGGTRVLVEKTEAGEIVSMALVTIGKRWTHNDTTATVLLMEGNREQMLEFVKQIASALGATELFVQNPLPVQRLKHREYTVIGYELQ